MTEQTFSLLDANSIHFVGIKGVALTSLAACFHDAGITITGSDVAEDFVTKEQLKLLPHEFQAGFDHPLPTATEAVIYTGAHQGSSNPQVLEALEKGLPTFSHAAALAQLFNQKKGLAVCGVGGKSTTSAMITWILDKLGADPSYAVGVGGIAGMKHTGRWNAESDFFVAEADEYSVDPSTAKYDRFVARFSYLKPTVIVCTNLAFDHPDVYRDFEQTKQVFLDFFLKLTNQGTLVVNGDDEELLKLATTSINQTGATLLTYGESSSYDFALSDFSAEPGISSCLINQTRMNLPLPGKFNCMNAAAAVAASTTVGFNLEESLQPLEQFHSTQRRFEKIGVKNMVTYYDDYAHHPSEVEAAIVALQEWYPTDSKVVVFQPHTFSRTKQLFDDFIKALATADTVYLLKIFPSAREAVDPTVTSQLLAEALKKRSAQSLVKTFDSLESLATALQLLPEKTVVLTLGAGDIYQVHDLIKEINE